MTTNARASSHAQPTAPPGTALNIVLWTFQVLVALAFLAAGSGKLLGNPDVVTLFAALGAGQWLRYLTGTLEIVGALLLVVPGKSAFGALLLAGVMAGAVVAHLTVLHNAPTVAVVLLALTALIALARRSQFAGLASR